MRDGAEVWREGKQQEGKRERSSFEEETLPACRGPPPPPPGAVTGTGLASTRAKSEDVHEGPGSHGGSSLPLAPMAYDLYKVGVVGQT